MMLSLVSPYWTAVFLARIVMPRSRSWSIESMTRSVSAAPSRNAPDWRSIASTSVVLPWSTWAMIATLRRSSRVAVFLARVEVMRRQRLGGRPPRPPLGCQAPRAGSTQGARHRCSGRRDVLVAVEHVVGVVRGLDRRQAGVGVLAVGV